MFGKISLGFVVLVSTGLLFATCTPAGVGGGAEGGDSNSGSGGRGGTNGTGAGSGGNGSTSGYGGGINVTFGDASVVTDATGPMNGDESRTDALLECGFEKFDVVRTPPNVLVVMDRSGSMMKNVAGEETDRSAERRWDIATSAINSITLDTQADISWGLKMYPTCRHSEGDDHPHRCNDGTGNHNPCAVTGMETLPALNRASAITSALAMATPTLNAGATPTALGIGSGVAMLTGLRSDRPKYLLVVTDGGPNCGVYTGSNCKVELGEAGCTMCGSPQCDVVLTSDLDRCSEVSTITWQPGCFVDKPCDRMGGCGAADDSVKAVRAAVASGITVFVLGFAIPAPGAGNLAHETLNLMAVAGGRPVDGGGAYKYYRANDQASLKKALNQIAASTVSCTFALDKPPADDAVAFVTVDDRTLPGDPMDGWSYGPARNTIIFNGTSCARLKAGDFKKTAITFGCPLNLPEPPPIVE
jgi:hypothetical protein